jgi:ribose transport system substrate-binding protein
MIRRAAAIAVVPKGASDLFWGSVQAGAIAARRDWASRSFGMAPSQDTEYSRQIQIVDSLVARQVDGLAVAGTDKRLDLEREKGYE